MTARGAQEGTKRIPGYLHVAEDCRAVSEVLSRVGDKWTVLVVSELGRGSRRFNELLRALERDGLVTRTVRPTVPPRVDYALTRLGRSLLEPVSALESWALRHRAAIAEARARYDAGKAAR